MIKSNRIFVSLLCAGLISTYPLQSLADQNVDSISVADAVDNAQSQAPCSYGQKINEKALRMVANFDSGLLEIPKNIINTSNDSNVFYGITGGLFKGLLNSIGRVGTSFIELVSLPIPTKPVAYPLYIWDDFDQDTRYNDFFRLDNCPPNGTVVATPELSEVKPRPAVVVPPRQALDPNYDENANRKLDTLFKKQMMK